MATTTEKKKPVVPPLDLSKLEGWNDQYFKVDRKKSRKKNKKKEEKKPSTGLGDTDDVKGLEISQEVTESLAAMFDETSGPYQYQFHREQVCLSFDPAVKLEPSLQPKLDIADDLAEDEEYDAGVKELEDVVRPACEKVLAKAKLDWAVKEKDFFEYRKMGERFAEMRAKKISEKEEEINHAKSSKTKEFLQNLQSELNQLKTIPDRGEKLNALYTEASEAADSLDFAVAFKKIAEATKAGQEIEKELSELADSVRRETDNAEAKDKEVFDFVSKTKDKKWGFDTDDDAKNFLIGQATDEKGALVKSDKLLAIEVQVAAALKRLDKLTAAGMSPEKAGDIAFKNIPKNFWPDRVVREVIMYKRARAQFEEEKRAELMAHQTQDLIDAVLAEEEKLGDKLESLSEGMDSVSEKLDPEKIEEQKKEVGKLAKLGMGALSDKAKDLLDKAGTVDLEKTFGDFTKDFGYATTGFGVLVKGAQAIKTGVDVQKGKDEGPVQKKLLEFKRNKAIYQLVDSLIGAGLGLDEIIPALKIASAGKVMAEEALKACMYMVKLLEIADLKDDAKMDPETMMALPLARMARNQGIRCSKSTVAVIVAAVQLAGAVGEMSGIGAHAGLALDVTGKVLSYGSKVVFKGIDWADARRCVKTMKKAAGPPPIRKAMTMIFKNSTRYATYALAFGAVEGNDPWAVQYLVNAKLTESDLKSPATSIEIVREYMLLTAGGVMGDEDKEEDDPTILPGQKKKGVKDKAKDKIKGVVIAGAKKVRDKIVGRDTSKAYDANWKAPAAALTRANWQSVKKEAVGAGWYDTRSGIGDVLGEYELAAAAFEKTPSTETACAVDAALDEVTSAITQVGTLANDQKTPHQGMIDFISAMYEKAEKEEERLRPLRQKLYDGQSFPGLQGEELGKAKQERLDKDLEAAKEKQAQKSAARLTKIQNFWNNRKHPTPYGNATLPDFCSKASEKLDLDPEEAMALCGSVVSIGEECCDELRDLLSGVPEDKFDKELDRQAAQLEKSLADDLRSLAESHFEAMKLRLGVVEDEWDAEDDGSKWVSPNFMLSEKGWEAAKKDAIKHGLVNKSTGVGKSLNLFEKAQTEYQKNHADEKNVRLVIGTLNNVTKAFEKFKPLNHKKFIHRGMADYRSKMLLKISEYEKSFQNERAKKKESSNEQKEEDEKKKAEKREANKIDYKATPFTKAAWKQIRDKGIKDGLKDKSTGLPKAFKIYEKALANYDNETDTGKKAKLRDTYLKAIGNLNDTLAKFEPKQTNKTEHEGMMYWRNEMINALAKIKSGLLK
jgi:hypothetical protein